MAEIDLQMKEQNFMAIIMTQAGCELGAKIFGQLVFKVFLHQKYTKIIHYQLCNWPKLLANKEGKYITYWMLVVVQQFLHITMKLQIILLNNFKVI